MALSCIKAILERYEGNTVAYPSYLSGDNAALLHASKHPGCLAVPAQRPPEAGGLVRVLRQIVKRILGERRTMKVREYRTRGRFCRSHSFRYWHMSAFICVQGFLLDKEAIQLYELTLGLDASEPVVVEVGSWLGKSSVVFGRALSRRGNGVLYCVDPFDASGDERSSKRYRTDAAELRVGLRERFEENLRHHGVDAHARVLQARSHEAVVAWDRPIDLLFIDGNHAFDVVAQDFRDWAPFVREGGLVAFHDTYLPDRLPADGNYHPGPGQVVSQFVIPDPAWRTLPQVHTLFVARKVSAR